MFDPSDLDFTQVPPVSGAASPYSVIARRAGATAEGGAKMFNISFLRDEADWNWTQSVKGCSTKYEHKFGFQLPENSQALTTFLQALDSASCCCGLGLIIRLNYGRILEAGEKFETGAAISRFPIVQNGSTGGTGKLYDDFNGGNIVLVGPYSRNLYEFSGTWADIEALM